MTTDRLCIVTGTTSGIGTAVAECLLAAGWHVVGIARRPAPLTHDAYSHVQMDLADAAAVQSYFEGDFARDHPAQRYQRVALVNNAALLEPVAPLERVTMDALGQAFSVNAVVPVWLMGFFLRYCDGVSLRIVNVSSGAATGPRAGWGAYCATKAALLMAGRVHADEAQAAEPRDAAVLSYEPGIVDTEMQGTIREHTAEDFPTVQRFRDFHAQGQLRPAQQPAQDIAAFLARDAAPPFSEGRIAG